MKVFIAIAVTVLLGMSASSASARTHVKTYRATSKFGPLACRLSGGNPPIMHCYPVRLQQ